MEAADASPGQLIEAAKHGDVARARALLAAGHLVNAQNGKYKNSAIGQAVKYQHFDMVKFLVKQKADVNIQSLYGWTPIMLACDVGPYRNRLDTVKYLVENKTDVHLRDRNTLNVLLHAASSNHLEVIKFLVGEAKANVNSQRIGKHMMSSLMYAASHNCTDIVRYLVEEGKASINGVTDEHGNTVMHKIVEEYGRSEPAEYLLQAKADVNIRNNLGRNCLMTALLGKNKRLALHMLENNLAENCFLDEEGRLVSVPEYYEANCRRPRRSTRLEFRWLIIPSIVMRDTIPGLMRVLMPEIGRALGHDPASYLP